MISQFASFILFQQSGSWMTSIPMMLAIFGIFYFLLIMPQQKKQKAWQKMLSEIKSGDRVTTTGGIIGIVISIRQAEGAGDTGSIILRVAPDNLKIEVTRAAIASVTVDDSAKKS